MPDRQPRGVKIRSDADQPNGEYTIEVWCENCHWEGNAAIPKGTAVAWGELIENLARCEECGCVTLRRHEQPEDETEELSADLPIEHDPVEALRRADDLQREFEEYFERQRRRMPSPALPALPVVPRPWEDGTYQTQPKWTTGIPPHKLQSPEVWYMTAEQIVQ